MLRNDEKIPGREALMMKVSERLRCCVCGTDTRDAADYVEIELRTESTAASQFFGAHAAHLNAVMADGFVVEVHNMGSD
jgi:hypothetical protein